MLPNPRPLGVTINGWLYLLGGILGLLGSFGVLITFASASALFGGMAALLGIVAFFVTLTIAGLYIWIGNGLLNGKRAAWVWALVLGGVPLFFTIAPWLISGLTPHPFMLVSVGISALLYLPLVLNGDWFEN